MVCGHFNTTSWWKTSLFYIGDLKFCYLICLLNQWNPMENPTKKAQGHGLRQRSTRQNLNAVYRYAKQDQTKETASDSLTQVPPSLKVTPSSPKQKNCKEPRRKGKWIWEKYWKERKQWVKPQQWKCNLVPQYIVWVWFRHQCSIWFPPWCSSCDLDIIKING